MLVSDVATMVVFLCHIRGSFDKFMFPRHPFPGCLFSGKLSGSVWYDFVRNHPVWHFAALAWPVYVCIGKAVVSKASKRVSFLLDPSQRGLWQYGSIDQSGASATEVLSVSGYRRSLLPHASLCYPESKCQDFAAHCFAQHSDPQVVCGRNHHGQHPESGHFVIALPGFHFPDNKFIEAFDAVVDGLSDLANYGLGKTEVREALRALSARKSLQWPAFFRPSDVDEILQQVVPSARNLKEPPRISSTDGRRKSLSDSGSSCLILANHKDLEALATAHVLRIWMFPFLIHKRINGPFVLSPNNYVMEIGSGETKFVILLCSKDCLEVPFMVSWIIQCYHFSSYCYLLPVLADEAFKVPGAAVDFNALEQSQSNVSKEDVENYLWVIQAAFTQIASRFYICYSGENAMKAKAVQIAQRLTTDVELLPFLLSVKKPREPSYMFEEAINRVRLSSAKRLHECGNVACRFVGPRSMFQVLVFFHLQLICVSFTVIHVLHL